MNLCDTSVCENMVRLSVCIYEILKFATGVET
jgi:hypothetical protein